ncbi:MAG: signal recognition particle-docking protein FtsY [Parachlamydiaceae bacterium]|nr:signal recognition particle-docking protein FtsY [Parachlamydiaceae bacterium]
MVLKFFKSSYAKVKSALSKARSFFTQTLTALFQGKINEDTLEKLERLLYESDFGVKTASDLTNKIRELHKKNPSLTTQDYINALRNEILEVLKRYPTNIAPPPKELPQVILVVGVNGNGKTTSVAKLAHIFTQNGFKVLLGAADTFRAAAIEQLETWALRAQVDIVKGAPKSDPASVAFDAVTAGKARHKDIVIIDTAGRLHTKTNLMQELEKIKRSCTKVSPNAPHETLLVLDATTGQNAIDQAKEFNKFTPITGLILTKLDGTAKGGIVIAIQQELGIPVKFIGTGEGLEDLQLFDPESFTSSLFE